MPDKKREQKEAPEFLYHYTSMDVLRNLLTYNKNIGDNMLFHASSVYYMNDSKEFKQSYKCIESKELYEEVLNEVRSGEPFLISFSSSLENEDFIPLWKMYGDDGYGVCLKFDTQELTQAVKMFCDKNNIHVEFNYCSTTLKHDPSKYADSINERIKHIHDRIADIRELAFYKHESWKYENEYRFMFFDELCNKYKNIEFKTIGHEIVPYMKIPIPISALKKIVVGPKADFEKSLRAITLMRAQYNGQYFEIYQSKTTLK